MTGSPLIAETIPGVKTLISQLSIMIYHRWGVNSTGERGSLQTIHRFASFE